MIMNNLKYFNKEINLAIKDNDALRFSKAWEDLEAWRDGPLFNEWMTLLHSPDSIAYEKKYNEYNNAWALGLRCLDIIIERASSGSDIDQYLLT